MDDRTHQQFGRYEILGELGRGAMGVVYKARDPRINRIVAIKTISLAGQPPEDEFDYRQRFFREAEAAGRVSHPGIVTIFDVGEDPETHAPYIVMEFVSGQSLDKLLASGDHKLPVETALQLALELAEALDCAHRQGVVHRDLKPANILMTEDGHAKIADFGVAKLNLANQTLAGRALGTPAYMSPEQLNGESVDGRSDLFSLGVILYTALTGYRPFQGNSAVTVSFRVVNHEPIPATVLDTALPEGLDAIIARAMAKDPADRYQSGVEMVADIRKLREERDSNSRARPGSSPAVDSAAQLATGKNPSPGPAQPPLGQPDLRQPAPKLARAARAASGHAASGQPSSGQSASGVSAFSQSAPGESTPAPKSPPTQRALPQMNLMAANFRKISLAAGAVLVGLFTLALWFISLGPQGVQPRSAEPMHPPQASSAVNKLATATASDPSRSTEQAEATASAERTKDRSQKQSKEQSKDGSKPARSHRTDSHTAEAATSALASAELTSATGAKDPSKPSAPHRTDSHAAKAVRPAVAEVSAVMLPTLVQEVTPALPTATLEIEVDHKFAEAQLSIWVDDSLSYNHVLEGTAKKRLVVFHHLEGHELHTMQVSPGKHRLRVRVTSDTPTYDQSAFVSSDFTGGQENVLRITFNKHGDINLSLQ